MFEVEAKVWVKDEFLWKALLEKVEKIADFEKEILKEDFYFGKKGTQKTLFRLRIYDGSKNEVCVKKKIIQNGVEENEESIFYVDNFEAFLSFSKKLGLEFFLQKKKKSRIFQKNQLKIELNEIENLGNFLEIESVFKKKSNLKKAHTEIVDMFAKLSFGKQDFEVRTYEELLSSSKNT